MVEIDPNQSFERKRREWNVQGFRTAAYAAAPLIVLSLFIQSLQTEVDF